ncbi:MAG TPA: SpoVA/SpoVAEb family sporulation membrane protein [Firmicutes bacterium]|nr:SpoVA/SpoVAEb family sporulation membrane protein [Bacillota bacterium]
MSYLWAFLIGGLICASGQLIFDLTVLTMGHVMVLFVVLGSVLTGLGLYEPLVKFAGAGASIPVSNFGYVLTTGVLNELKNNGIFGALSGVFELAGGAIAAAIFFGFVFGLIGRAKG